MRAISADKFLDLEGVRFGIDIDGDALPEPAWTAFENGNFTDGPWSSASQNKFDIDTVDTME
ncbi:hypothetical protein [Pelagibacterium sp.]|uniref:hypothetical protein n=1 Tax=Pelagibacterium sp. TaxID=1967288 RepID=UPI003BAAA04B